MPDCNYCLTQCNVYPDGNITKINSVMYTKTQGCSVFNSKRKKNMESKPHVFIASIIA